MKTILTAIYSVLSAMNPAISSAIVAVPTVVAFFAFVKSQVDAMLAAVDAMVVTNFTSVTLAPLGLVDTFFPLSEAILMFGAYAVIMVSAATIRIIKSFVPTLAS